MLGNARPIFSRAERNTALLIILAAIASALILILLLKRNPNTPYRIIVNMRAGGAKPFSCYFWGVRMRGGCVGYG